MDLAEIRRGLTARLPESLVDETLDAYSEAKRNFYLGGFRLSAVEGGRFAEAVFRLLEQITTGSHTPLGSGLDSEALIKRLASLPARGQASSVRVHIPRSLRVVYDIRNQRDAAHLADGIDPNMQDASLVVAVLDWVIAELVRLYHAVPANEAQAIVNDLVTRQSPAVQDFSGFMKVLKPQLRAADHCLLLLYQQGSKGATYSELKAWSRPNMRRNLRRTLRSLVDMALVHQATDQYTITIRGLREAEKRGLPVADSI